ncbi:luciferase-like protein [Coleophoma crateriformis]|uniref:Luciferase-like protein n=1 Tax=Coleophoma crateriformis TaxID=565419 RepID=A0A3D8QQ05_9HELO|nr:luciferase-like protein [Coleophoma crateriformis]
MVNQPHKKIQLNFFETACTGTVNAIGQWKHVPPNLPIHRNKSLTHDRDPKDVSKTKDRLAYYMNLAQLAEKGKISSIFFADSYGGHEIFEGKADAQYKGGSHVAKLDPTVFISAMATVTDSVGFGITGSTTHIPPYLLARTWSTLDHVTDGRMAWNIVTSFSDSSAKALGLDNMLPHDERYNAAEEYMDVIYQLWEKSWEDGAQKWQAEPEMAYDPSKVHRIEYQGKYLKFSGVQQAHPSPQRTPLIFQAGASKAGIAFGGKHAEAIFCAHSSVADCKRYTQSVRAAAAAAGRDPQAIKFFLGAMPFLGRTREEAEEKFEAARKRASIQGGLARFSGFVNVDMSVYPVDEPFKFKGELKENAVQGIVNSMKSMNDNQDMTPRDVGEILAFGGIGPRPVGTAEMVADELQKWMEEGDIDGFNLSPVSMPSSWEDIVDLLVPELQRRGLYWDDYPAPGGTLRENVYSAPGKPFLADDHPGSRFKWNAPKVEEKKTNGEVDGVQARV